MELISYKSYVDNLIIENFNYSSFAPENRGKLFDVFKKYFYQETAYWKPIHIEEDIFYIEFKKYGNNRKQILLRFSFISNSKSPRELGLALTNDELKVIDETLIEIPLSNIWKDHAVLADHLKNLINKGLELAEKINP